MTVEATWIKTKWNLGLLYDSLTDPRIEEDISKHERAFEDFERRYRNDTAYLGDVVALCIALPDYESLWRVGNYKPLRYLSFVNTLDSTNAECKALQQKITERLVRAGNRIKFFPLSLGKISKEAQEAFLARELLAPYRYWLSKLFEEARHKLTEPEEKILALKANTSSGMWTSGVKNTLNKQVITFDGTEIPLNEAEGKVSTIHDTEKRRALWSAVIEGYQRLGDFAESEINAVFTDKKINDELRGYKEPYDATILGYENKRESVLALVKTVTENFSVSQRFFEVKCRMLALPELTYADRGVSPGRQMRSYSFTESVRITENALDRADPRYGNIFRDYLRHGQIDVFPHANRASGGFCAGTIDLPTFIFLNHADNLRSLSTLAHEVGHGIHYERSKVQSPMYQQFTIPVAETASTFFEGLAFNRAMKEMDASEKAIALHERLNGEIATIFRQIAFFNFEEELHRAVREDGWVTKEEIARMLNRHTGAYMGPTMKLRDEDGYFFITVPHFRYMFYVYSYAYGQLISRALVRRVQNDSAYIKQVDRFLSAGGSQKPEHIFADIGIEVNEEFFREGIAEIEKDLSELEQLVA